MSFNLKDGKIILQRQFQMCACLQHIRTFGLLKLRLWQKWVTVSKLFDIVVKKSQFLTRINADEEKVDIIESRGSAYKR